MWQLNVVVIAIIETFLYSIRLIKNRCFLLETYALIANNAILWEQSNKTCG